MKKIILPVSTLLVSGFSLAQTSTENYIQSRAYLEPVTTSSSTAKQIQSVQYFDGLGRPKQIINVKATPQGKDLVTPIVYDAFGRQTRNYFPIPQTSTTNGNIYQQNNALVPFPVNDDTNIYQGERIFTEKNIENSPLDKLIEQKQIGEAWNNKPIKFDYDLNADGNAKKYTATFNYATFESTITFSGNYTAGQLYKNSITDEDGNKTIEFKNAKGQVILVKKAISTTESADTYYVYNDYDQLAYILSPKAVDEIKNLSFGASVPDTVLNNLCYQYKYDNKGRLVEKKLPGKGLEYMVYDKQDRLVATQDANLRANNQWLYTKYDQLGRVVMTGLSIGYGSTRLSEQDNADTTGSSNVKRSPYVSFIVQGMEGYYENYDQTYPNSSRWVKLLSVNYYDTYPVYSFNPAFPSTIIGQSVLTDTPDANGLTTKSLPVMSLVKNIEDDNWTKNYTYYDKKGRTIGTYSINHLGGYTKTESELDFAGVVTLAKTYHKRLDTDTEKLITETFEYDNQNRLLVHKHKVDNNTEEILAQNTYNELSQLSNKKVGGIDTSTPLQSIDYSYNIRGWMTKINDPVNLNGKLFGYKVKYNEVEGLEIPNTDFSTLKVKPKYNGNIAEVDWRTGTVTGDNLRRYGYVYDNLNRLSAGFYQKDTNPSAKEYFEKMDYDLNGNITNLKRSAESQQGASAFNIDDLAYVYTGNRLTSVTDSSTDYRGYPDTSGNNIPYDINGNMTSQKDKGILLIDYNFLNLPNYLKFNSGLSTRTGMINENTNYLYRADGIKLRKTFNYAPYNPLGTITQLSSKVTEYLDGFQYEGGKSGKQGIVSNLILKFVPTAEGYYNFENNKYIYNYTDHLGNVRLSYFKNGTSVEILEENNYYPFGMKHEGYNALAGNPAYTYSYNGKELQTESGMYDYGARMYMSDIGRWSVVDPLSEKYYNYSGYNYAINNPIYYIDPDGRTIEPVDKRSGRRVQREIRKTFREQGYNNVAKLFKYDKSTGVFNNISQGAFDKAISKDVTNNNNLSQSQKSDVTALAKGYFDATNSSEVHSVEMVKRGESFAVAKSNETGDYNGDGKVNGADADDYAGGGFNYPTTNGSHTVIVTNSTVPIPDYIENSTGSYATELKSTAGELLAHEMLGHGLSNYNSMGDQHTNAVQTTNLYRRVTSGGPRLYRDGTSHGTGVKLPKSMSWQIPSHLK